MKETNCQVLDFPCDDADLCTRCKGSGNEPSTPDGGDPCSGCEHCWDEVVGWCTGIEPGTVSQTRARRFVGSKRS